MTGVTPEMAQRARALLAEYQRTAEEAANPPAEATPWERAQLDLAGRIARTVIAWAHEQLDQAEAGQPIPGAGMKG